MVKYLKIGVCGLSCRLCPTYHVDGVSKCGGCLSESRMAVGCPFITCAVKKKGITFCWDCVDEKNCEKWRNHREFSQQFDTFTCYQKLEDNISFIRKKGVDEFEKEQKIRENLLKEMLRDFNEGRSKRYYCIAATVLELDELKAVLSAAREHSENLGLKERSKLLHLQLDKLAEKRNYTLKLRKWRKNSGSQ